MKGVRITNFVNHHPQGLVGLLRSCLQAAMRFTRTVFGVSVESSWARSRAYRRLHRVPRTVWARLGVAAGFSENFS